METVTLSHWDRLPLEIRQRIQWLADRTHARDRLEQGVKQIHCQGFRNICCLCDVLLQWGEVYSPSISGRYPSPHCQRCNVWYHRECLHYTTQPKEITNHSAYCNIKIDRQYTFRWLYWYEVYWPIGPKIEL